MAADGPSRRQLNGLCLIGSVKGRVVDICGAGVFFPLVLGRR